MWGNAVQLFGPSNQTTEKYDNIIHNGLKQLLVNNCYNQQPTKKHAEVANEETERRCERCGPWGKCDFIVLGS